MIESTLQDDIAVIALNRPDKRNAMTPEMLVELQRRIESLDDSTKAMVLVGNGKTFCAGFDLKMCADDPQGGTMRALLTELSNSVALMRSQPFPIVLGVHGAAVAGGCALLGGADIVVADKSAKLGYPVVKIGVSPAISAPYMLASIAPGAVRARLLDTELISAARAYEIGLVHELVDTADAVKARCITIAQALASKPGTGVRETKAWLNTITEPITANAQTGLEVSLSLTGTDEERQRLQALWGN
ncbi:MAG: enoyl-CoA hydratase/isomerase family protein [Phycisphaerales bacterium]|nr:enoyl-CoA hydratase/isomerase family protein [Phycisphaerales bacterium]